MFKTFFVLGTYLAGLASLMLPATASAAVPAVDRITAVFGLGDRQRNTDLYHPMFVTVRVEGTNLGSSADNSSIYLTGWKPRNQIVRRIARRITSRLGMQKKGNEVLEWNDAELQYIQVVFDISRYYPDAASIAEFTQHLDDLRVEVKTPGGTSGPQPLDLVFQYDRWRLNQPKGPIALAQGPNGDVYINYELNPVDFSVWRSQDESVGVIPVPSNEAVGPFGPNETWSNGNGQDVTFGADRVWFGQSGPWIFSDPDPGEISQSRIVSYNPSTEALDPTGHAIAGTGEVKKYIVAEDDEPIMGVLYDPYRNRIWYSTADPGCGVFCKSAIGSFDLGHCANNPATSCATDSSCPGSTCNSTLVEESIGDIPVPIRLSNSSNLDRTVYPVKMTFDHTELHNLWFSSHAGNFLGRIKLTQACLDDPAECVVDRYRIPLTTDRNDFGVGGWSIDTAPDGDIVFNTYFEGTLARFDVDGGDTTTDGAEDERCKIGTGDPGDPNPEDPNPCITSVEVPLAQNTNSTDERVHTMALDEARCLLWYTYFTKVPLVGYRDNTVGFAPLSLAGGFATVTKVPALYPFENHGEEPAVTQLTGIIVANDGSVFFTDYERQQLGRLKPIEPYMVEHCP